MKKEASSLATLQHPNIVTIYDLGSDEEGTFIVMELLEGDTLADWIRGSTLSLHDFYELATQTLEGALNAHSLSILHRDLKPENIKVRRMPAADSRRRSSISASPVFPTGPRSKLKTSAAMCWAPSFTWRPSSSSAARWMAARTCILWAASTISASRAAALLSMPPWPASCSCI